MHDVVAPTINNHNLGATGPANQNFNKNITSNLSSNRTGLGGRGLGGVGGSIISSSGINQNFKDYSNNQAKGPGGPSPAGGVQNPISNKEQR